MAGVINKTIASKGLNPNVVMQQTGNTGGCAVVTPLPNATGYVRIASKFFFANINDAQWLDIQAALYTELFVRVRTPIGGGAEV